MNLGQDAEYLTPSKVSDFLQLKLHTHTFLSLDSQCLSIVLLCVSLFVQIEVTKSDVGVNTNLRAVWESDWTVLRGGNDS